VMELRLADQTLHLEVADALRSTSR
jgi:hypothetical protein